MQGGDARPRADARGAPGSRSRGWITRGRERIDRVRPVLRRPARALGRRISEMSYLPKWLLLASAIGVIAGLGAILFYEALSLATHLFLQDLAGYRVPTPAGEGNLAGSARYTRPWAIPLAVTLGGLLAGFIVFTWAPEAEGHGTDAAIDAIHHNPRGIRFRAVVVKIVASAITIGSGGSGGREGPTAQISAGFGSLLARLLDLSPEDGRIAVSVGIGSGIGAIFSAPLGGAVLAAEIVYREDFEPQALLPGVLASIVAYTIFGAALGYHSLFSLGAPYVYHQPVDLLWFALLGLLAGGIGLLYSKSFYGVVDLSRRLPFSRKLRPALGGLLVGLMALGSPEVLGSGYGWIQKGLVGDISQIPLYLIFLLPFARIAATALSIGTGGSGGVFGPGMVIGAFTGLALWRMLEPFAPGVGHDPAPFVVVGMMAVFGGISRAPIAVMLMVAEMTGNISLLGPAMVAVAIAWFIVGRVDDSIYRSQPRSREDTAVRRLQSGLPLLGTRTVESVASPPRVVLREGTTAAAALEQLGAAGVPGAPVVDGDGTFLGAVEGERLRRLAAADPDSGLGPALDDTAPAVARTATLADGLDVLTQAGGRWVTVTSGDRQVAAILGVGDIVRGYRQALREDASRIATLGGRPLTVEERVGAGSPLAGRPLRDVRLPRGCVVVAVHDGNALWFATGSTVPAVGDVVSALVTPESAEDARALIRGDPAAPSGEDGPAPADGAGSPAAAPGTRSPGRPVLG